MIEYVALGDFQTAVGFLLASTPEKSIRYYRDALCTLALAVSPSLAESCYPWTMLALLALGGAAAGGAHRMLLLCACPVRRRAQREVLLRTNLQIKHSATWDALKAGRKRCRAGGVHGAVHGGAGGGPRDGVAHAPHPGRQGDRRARGLHRRRPPRRAPSLLRRWAGSLHASFITHHCKMQAIKTPTNYFVCRFVAV